MKAIEVEKKVRLEPDQIKKITQNALFLKEMCIQDIYFDTPDYRYTTQDIWLRQRNGVFELKIGIKNSSMDLYEEITEEKSILIALGIEVEEDMTKALFQNGIVSFCSFITQRKSYQLDALKIDIDEADFGDFNYSVAEIEMMVSDLNKVEQAEQIITEFLKDMDIDPSIPVPGKLKYYISCRRPEHYQALGNPFKSF